MTQVVASSRAGVSPHPPGEPDPHTVDPNGRSTGALIGIAATTGIGVSRRYLLNQIRILRSYGHNKRIDLAAVHDATAGAQGLAQPTTPPRANGIHGAATKLRAVIAGPEFKQRRLWAINMITGVPENGVVPLEGGVLKLTEKIGTTQAWRHSYQLSNALGWYLMFAGPILGVPNLRDGLRRDGVRGLWDTRSGRTGVVSIAGTALDVTVLSIAMITSVRGHGSGGNLVTRALADPIYSAKLITRSRIAMSATIGLNETGLLDSMNAGETRPPWQVAIETPAWWYDGFRRNMGWEHPTPGPSTTPTPTASHH